MKSPGAGAFLIPTCTLVAGFVLGGVFFPKPDPPQAVVSVQEKAPAPNTNPQIAPQPGIEGGREAEPAVVDRGHSPSSETLAAEILRVAGNPHARRQWRNLMRVTEQVNASNAAAILKRLEPLLSNQERGFVIGEIVAQWAVEDPQAALGYAVGLHDKRIQMMAISGAVTEWAEKDPTAAERWVSTLTDPRIREEAFAALAGTIAASDPEKALAMVAKGNARNSGTYSIFSQWAARDPRAAVERALLLPKSETRWQGVNAAVTRWAVSDPKAALAWVQGQPVSPEQARVLGLVLGHLGRSDPKTAVEYALSMTPGNERRNALGNIVTSLADQDFQAAVAVLNRLPEGSERSGVIQNMSWRVAENDPQAAMSLAELLPTGDSQDQVLRNVASQWARKDPVAVQQWARMQTDEQVKNLVWPSIIGAVSAYDPKQAVGLLGNLPAGEPRSRAVSELVGHWGHQDPVAASQWAATLGPAEKSSAYGNLASQWGNRDSTGAAAWLKTLESGNARDNAINSFCFAVSGNDPKLAVQWASSMENPQRRDSILESLARNWIRNDPVAARQWVSQSTLGPEIKARLLK